MDFGKAFTFMFEDPDWLRKLGIGTLVGLAGLVLAPVLIGVVPLLMLLGYTIETQRNVMRGDPRPMPEWNDWGGFLSLGFKVAAATFVWLLPFFLLYIPMFIGAMLIDQSSGRGAEAIGIPIMVCGGCLMLLWGLFVALLTPAIYVRIAATDRFTSAFEFSRIWAFTRDNLGGVVIALLLLIVVGIVASVIAFLGVLAVFIGLLITIPFATLWQYLVQAHLFGQIAKYSVAPIE